ncbi:MAG: hypothetical protein KDB23_20630, partial [Planctomycetales bacterium]|nr:hypothetical protein [Planctomycetales bacterium]
MFKQPSTSSNRRPARSRRSHESRRLAIEPLETRWVLDSVVVFNELMYHPSTADARGEWIELR